MGHLGGDRPKCLVELEGKPLLERQITALRRGGVEEIHKASADVAQIIGQIRTLLPRFQAVNDGMQAQASGAEQIGDNLGHLSEAARKTAEALRQCHAIVEQLNGTARGLETSVARFKFGNHT